MSQTMVEVTETTFEGLNVEDCWSGNSILLTDVDADLGLPLSSVSLPKTATPSAFKIGFSQGRVSISVRSAMSITVFLDTSLSSELSLEVSLVSKFSSSLKIAQQ